MTCPNSSRQAGDQGGILVTAFNCVPRETVEHILTGIIGSTAGLMRGSGLIKVYLESINDFLCLEINAGGNQVESMICIAIGTAVGAGAAFTGLGGGFLMVPLLLFLGYSAQKAVGTSFMAILIISLSALLAHGRLDNVDFRTGVLLGLGGLIGAQLGALFLEHVTTCQFKKVFALVLVCLAGYLFFEA